MIKRIVVWAVVMGAVLSGCGKSIDEKTDSSPQHSEQKTKPAAKTPSKSPASTETPQASEPISGVWKATGKQDGVSSTWSFNDGELTVNYVFHFSYMIDKNKDHNGYTAITIKNSQGKKHALLLKRNGSDFDGITAEGEAYSKYLADGTIPEGQIIHFTSHKNAWGSMDEAIQFYENTYKNTNNELSKEIAWENYRKDLWDLVEKGTSDNTITLHWTNIGGAGGSYDQFVKNGETTILTFFDGNAGYPNHPSMRYTVRNSDYKVIKTEELWKKK